MSTQHNNSKQSLQSKVTNLVDDRPNVAALYRLFNLEEKNTGQERRRQVDELIVQRTVMDATVKICLIKKLLDQ